MQDNYRAKQSVGNTCIKQFPLLRRKPSEVSKKKKIKKKKGVTGAVMFGEIITNTQ